MGTVKASDIFSKADGILKDTAKVRWTDANKLKSLNAGQRQIVLLKPTANVLNTTYRLVAGTKQSIPDGTATFQTPAGVTIAEGIQLIRLVRNMGLTGLVAGAAITPVGMDLMDAMNPDWHLATTSATVLNYIFNDEDPTHFYVSPPQPTGANAQNYVEAILSAVPADVVAAGGSSYDVAITLSDIYQDILLNYILFECYAEDAAVSPLNGQRAVEYWNMFVLALERKDLVRKEYSPNMRKVNPSTE